MAPILIFSLHVIYVFEQLRRYFVMSGAMLGLKTIDQSEHFIAVGICNCKVGNRGISRIGTENGLVSIPSARSEPMAVKYSLSLLAIVVILFTWPPSKKNVFGYTDFDFNLLMMFSTYPKCFLCPIYIFQTDEHSTPFLPVLYFCSEYHYILWDYV